MGTEEGSSLGASVLRKSPGVQGRCLEGARCFGEHGPASGDLSLLLRPRRVLVPLIWLLLWKDWGGVGVGEGKGGRAVGSREVNGHVSRFKCFVPSVLLGLHMPHLSLRVTHPELCFKLKTIGT